MEEKNRFTLINYGPISGLGRERVQRFNFYSVVLIMALKVKKGDTVVVITGKDKGRRAEVKRCVKINYVIVEGVNLVKKHVRPNPQRGVEGGIVQKELPIHVSNVALYNPVTQKTDRVGFRILEDGRKVRYFKSNNEVIDL